MMNRIDRWMQELVCAEVETGTWEIFYTTVLYLVAGLKPSETGVAGTTYHTVVGILLPVCSRQLKTLFLADFQVTQQLERKLYMQLWFIF